MDKNPLEALRELAVEQHPMIFQTNELVIISTALEGLGQEITKRMSGADPEQVQVYARMLAEAKTLENRIDTLVHAALADKLAELAKTEEQE